MYKNVINLYQNYGQSPSGICKLSRFLSILFRPIGSLTQRLFKIIRLSNCMTHGEVY